MLTPDSAPKKTDHAITRRSLLSRGAGTAALLGLPALASSVHAAEKKSEAKAKRGGIKQSIVHWCFADHWNIEQTAKIAKKLGCQSIELVAPDTWPTLKKYGLLRPDFSVNSPKRNTSSSSAKSRNSFL